MVAVSGVVTTVVLVANRGQDAGAPPAATMVATSTTTPQAAGATTTAPGTTTTTAPTTVTTTAAPARPSATTALQPFFTAAATLDRQLRTAAATINGSGPPWQTISADVARTVRAADLTPVANAIPAGLPRGLLRSVVLVYSDLASRRSAMATFAVATTIDPVAYPTNQDLLDELGNGHAGAVRFADDLAAARARAAATPAVPVLPATSRQAGEVRLYVQYVNLINSGCGTRGGHIVTEPPTIVWNGRPGAGTIADVTFTASLRADGWTFNVIAC